MSQKQKFEKSPFDRASLDHFKDVILHPHLHMSVAFMGAATLAGVLSHSIKTPALAAIESVRVVNVSGHGDANHERRENEVHPRHGAYSAAQRTPSRSGNS